LPDDNAGRERHPSWTSVWIDALCNDIPGDEVPIEIIDATSEAASREGGSPGSLTPDRESGPA
jgi:hypothetical protein